LIVDTLIRIAFTGEQVTNSPNSQTSTLNSQTPNPQPENPQVNSDQNPQLNEQISTRMDVEKLKIIDELSRIILELKKQFPELAQRLEKARDNVSVNPELISAKNTQNNLANILNAIQQNLNKPELAEAVKNLVQEALKILKPSVEIPQENKLISALSQNDFARANAIIKNIVEQAQPTTQPTLNSPLPTPNSQPITNQPTLNPPLSTLNSQLSTTNYQPATTNPQLPTLNPQLPTLNSQPVTNQIILNVLQELKTLGIPKEFQSTPLKELEAIILQKTGVEIDKTFAKNLQTLFNEKPAFAVTAEIPLPKNILQAVMQKIPPARAENFQPQRPIENPLPQQPLPQQSTLVRAENFQPQRPIENPLPQQPLPQQSTPVRAENFQPQPPIENPLPQQPQPQQSTLVRAENFQPQPPIENPLPQQPVRVENFQPRPPIENPLPQQPLPQQSTLVRAENFQPQPPIENPLPQQPQPQSTPAPKTEIAFSLYQIIATPPTSQASPSPNPIANTPYSIAQNSTPIFILQPWPASVHIPKEEQNFWLKTELPLTPQTIELRNTILSFGKLPESPETVKQFAQTLHEMSLQTENGKPPTKEQANLLWRIMTTANTTSLELGVTNSLLKYQPAGNIEGELLKTLPEAVRKDVLKELPEGKTWQPETLQKAIEKFLYTSSVSEEQRSVLQTLKQQIQWTRLDQDTRPAQDRDNVFYFMHNNELQKGRLKIKDQRKGGEKKHQSSSMSFSIETKAKNLGDVHADLILTKTTLNIRLQDSIGTASEAIKAERETLSKELSDIGISLGELLYGKTPKLQTLPITEKKEKNKSGLDIKA